MIILNYNLKNLYKDKNKINKNLLNFQDNK